MSNNQKTVREQDWSITTFHPSQAFSASTLSKLHTEQINIPTVENEENTRRFIKSNHLRDHDELTNGRDTINKHVNDIRARGSDARVRRHRDGDGLGGGSGVEAGGVQPYHAVTHVYGVSDETTIVERNLDSLGSSVIGEGDCELGAVGLESLGRQHNLGWADGVTLKIRRSVDLVTELSDVGVGSGRCIHGLLNRVGARDEEGTVKEEQGNTVIETGDGGLGSSAPSLAESLGRIVN
jgi:hypothetical protein